MIGSFMAILNIQITNASLLNIEAESTPVSATGHGFRLRT
jgi:hypothetical protein